MTESKRRDRHYFEQVKRCWAMLPEPDRTLGRCLQRS